MERATILDGRHPRAAKELRLKNIQHLQGVVEQIDGINLPDGTAPALLEELNERKLKAKELVKTVLGNAREYKRIALELSYNAANARNEENTTQSDYKKKVESSDKNQRIKHNALVDSINIANRYIRGNFGELNEDGLDDGEEQEARHGRAVLPLQRVSFPQNIICPHWVNLERRESIGDWGKQIAEELETGASPV